MSQLDDIAPRRLELVHDLVRAAGIDVTDWANYKRGPKYAASNPRYCYEWVFIKDNRLIVLNLWHEDMKEANGVVSSTFNMRPPAQQGKSAPHKNSTKSVWSKRAQRMDAALQLAAQNHLPIQVIVCAGKGRNPARGNDKPSRVVGRVLDSVPWTVSSYDWSTGAVVLSRGASRPQYVDQFSPDIIQQDRPPEKREVIGETYVRSSEVRRQVLERASGICELCSERGFLTSTGQIYLETHHVVPLSENGADHPSNVAALCPDDHRRAHYADDRNEIRKRLLRFLGRQT